MQTQPFKFHIQTHFKITFTVVLIASLVLATVAYASHATGGSENYP